MRAAAILWGLFCAIAITAGFFPPILQRQVTSSNVRWVETEKSRTAVHLPFRGAAFFAPVLPSYLYVTQSTKSVATVSASDYYYISYSRTLLPKIFPGLYQIDTSTVSRSANPAGNLEAMLRLRPGAIFCFAASYAQPLARLGLPIVPIPNVPADPEQSVLQQAKTYQQVAGIQGRAELLWTNYNREFASLRDDLQLPPPAKRPRVLLLNFQQPGRLFLVPGKGDLFTRYLERAGASVIQARGGRNMSLEQILLADPDIILLLPLTKMTPIDLYSGPVFASLRAARAKRVYRVPTGLQDSFFNNVVDSPLFSRWLAEILYPNSMPRSTRQHMRCMYQRDFDYRISDAELDITLALGENRDSAGYARFQR